MEKLAGRKQELRRLLSRASASRLQYVDHGQEGIVAKPSFGSYVTVAKRTMWFKIKNRGYSQMAGREELFNRERHSEPTPGWYACDLACAEAS